MSSQERIRQPILPGARLARVVSLVVLLSAVITQELAATDARTFRVSDIVAESGTVASGNLHVPDGPDGTTSMPVTVVHGAKPGPVLALCAGIHGSEYAPVIALQGFRSEIDPAKLSGVLILVHVANPPSFFGRSGPSQKSSSMDMAGFLESASTMSHSAK
ncbi:MAG TPA: succinylglutamate desuccinylase/aspartoacylase family protein [Terriglobales bacterium]